MLVTDNDIIRGLGFVTLYSAYAEEQIDNILERLQSIEPFTEKMNRWPISKKLKHAASLVKKLASTELAEFESALLAEFESALIAGLVLFERRNEVVHGRIYAEFAEADTLKSARAGVPPRNVTAHELYELANDFYLYRSDLIRPQIFKLDSAMAEHKSRSY